MNQPLEDTNLQSVFTAIVGKPNVGKSSLLNRLIGEKAAIVTNKPQTTRTRITGILTEGIVQYVFLDTPGFHLPRTKLGERMTRTVRDSLTEVDAVLMLFEPETFISTEEEQLLEAVKGSKIPAIGIINKADTVKNKNVLEERKMQLEKTGVFKLIHTISAQTGEGCKELLTLLLPYTAIGPHYFSDDSFTDIPEKQLVAEIVREKLLLHLHEEIPHGTAVEVDRFKDRKNSPIIDIDVNIFCEKKSHKGMIIGKGGQMLKKIATDARIDCEELLGTKVNLTCWVKIKSDWRDDDNLLNQMGFRK